MWMKSAIFIKHRNASETLQYKGHRDCPIPSQWITRMHAAISTPSKKNMNCHAVRRLLWDFVDALALWENDRRCSLLRGRIWNQIFPSLSCFVPTGFRTATRGQSAGKQMMLWKGNHGNHTSESLGNSLQVLKSTSGRDMDGWLSYTCFPPITPFALLYRVCISLGLTGVMTPVSHVLFTYLLLTLVPLDQLQLLFPHSLWALPPLLVTYLVSWFLSSFLIYLFVPSAFLALPCLPAQHSH